MHTHSSDGGSGDGEPQAEAESGRRKKTFWKRPLTWVVTVLLGAAATVPSGALQGLFKTVGSKVVNEFGKEQTPFTVTFEDNTCPAVWSHFPDELRTCPPGRRRRS